MELIRVSLASAGAPRGSQSLLTFCFMLFLLLCFPLQSLHEALKLLVSDTFKTFRSLWEMAGQ